MTRITDTEIANTRETSSKIRPTPGQTVGPFFKFGLEYGGDNQVAHPYAPGTIRLSGRVLDGEGNAIPDAIVEIWQLDADGTVPRARGSLKRDGHSFTGFGRCATTDEGHYEFWTRSPGAVDGNASFFAVSVFARGLLDRLPTRVYLPEDATALAADPLLQGLSVDERATLIATRDEEGNLHHDFRLQGENETVFLAFRDGR